MLKRILLIGLLIGAIAFYFGYAKYNDIFKANVPDKLSDPYLYIPTGAGFDEVLKGLLAKKMIDDEASFTWVAEYMNYDRQLVRAGRYKIKPGWSNRALIQHLRSGKQATNKLVLNNERLLEDVAQKAARFLEVDSQAIANVLFNEQLIKQHGYTNQTLMSLFIPNTYDFFWNQSAKDFFNRMVKEHKTFWNKGSRVEKAGKLNLSQEEVYTLASIVERETNKNDEKQRIAGVYLNRLKKGMLLQADPTAVFATRDFKARRVLNKHINFDSPYNTYMYPGLPPGPISMASIASIDAVLDAEDHDYIFFCAKPGKSGYHSFAKTLRGHNNNAAKYRSWLRKRKIK